MYVCIDVLPTVHPNIMPQAVSQSVTWLAAENWKQDHSSPSSLFWILYHFQVFKTCIHLKKKKKRHQLKHKLTNFESITRHNWQQHKPFPFDTHTPQYPISYPFHPWPHIPNFLPDPCAPSYPLSLTPTPS